ncbi:hypothetical protein [Cohnella sp. GCM10027633]|uniref:hypothetical protein n=1 Tax=unclassified Cohnella TaxID=2636738 RepID=UPI003624CC33
MDDKELRERLARGPLARDGFNEELRRRINEEIDRPGKRTRRLWAPWARLGGTFAMACAVLFGLWIWQAQPNGSPFEDRLQADRIEGASPSASEVAFTTEPPRSVMLIGLRKDMPEGQSAYRSILVAPEDGELTVNASLEGIYMPYKMKFYRLDAVGDSMGKGTQTIVSTPAGEALPITVKADSAYRTNEKLLFAGNKYVSLIQTKTSVDTGETSAHVWVKDIEQLAPTLRETVAKSGEEPHHGLTELVPSSSTFTNEWAITRQEGRWVGKVPSEAAGIENPTEALAGIADAKIVGVQLPLEVSSYDTLWLSWDDIRSREPAALDAFTSRTQDLLAVQTANEITVSAYRMKESDMKPLSIPLQDGESVVMVQWAQDGYVDTWKQMLGQWIATASGD